MGVFVFRDRSWGVVVLMNRVVPRLIIGTCSDLRRIIFWHGASYIFFNFRLFEAIGQGARKTDEYFGTNGAKVEMIENFFLC